MITVFINGRKHNNIECIQNNNGKEIIIKGTGLNVSIVDNKAKFKIILNSTSDSRTLTFDGEIQELYTDGSNNLSDSYYEMTVIPLNMLVGLENRRQVNEL